MVVCRLINELERPFDLDTTCARFSIVESHL